MRSLCLVFILLVTSSLTFCQSKPPNCISYLSLLNGTFDCYSCDLGYVIAQNSTSGLRSCYGCSPGCQSCQNAGPTKCDTCSQGYTLLNPGETCSPCAANCTKCDDVAGGGQCDPGSCQQGFGNNPVGGWRDCVKCYDDACLNCSLNYLNCTTYGTCSPGKYMNYSEETLQNVTQTHGTCYSCIANCQNCTNGENCTTCIPGYVNVSYPVKQNNVVIGFSYLCEPVSNVVVTDYNYIGVIISVVSGLLMTIAVAFVCYRQGKKSAADMDKKLSDSSVSAL